jgi:hypothetical protein
MLSRARSAVKAPRHAAFALAKSPEIVNSRRPFIRENRGTWEVWNLQRLVKSFPDAVSAAMYMQRMLSSSAKKKSAGKRIVHKVRSLKNPALEHPGREAEANEYANALFSLTKEGPEIAKVVRSESKKSGYNRTKMVAFIALKYAKSGIHAYTRNANETSKAATASMKKRVAEIFVENVEDGEW